MELKNLFLPGYCHLNVIVFFILGMKFPVSLHVIPSIHRMIKTQSKHK